MKPIKSAVNCPSLKGFDLFMGVFHHMCQNISFPEVYCLSTSYKNCRREFMKCQTNTLQSTSTRIQIYRFPSLIHGNGTEFLQTLCRSILRRAVEHVFSPFPFCERVVRMIQTARSTHSPKIPLFFEQFFS